MVKRCQTCSNIIDSGLTCDDCTPPPYKLGVVKKPSQDLGLFQRALVKDLDKIVSESKGRNMTLPIDSAARKNYPILSGCINYFPAALAGVAKVSKAGNDKHNPGQPLHHARGKSTDHADCIVRHLIDVQDLMAQFKRSAPTPQVIEGLLTEVSSLAWRALALSQELHEQFGAPLAPGAKNE